MRLQVALNYLTPEERAETLKRLGERYGRAQLKLDQFDQSTKLNRITEIIAGLYRQIIETGQFSKPDADIATTAEKEIAGAFGSMVRQLFESAREQVEQSFQQVRAQLSQPLMDLAARIMPAALPQAQPSNNLWQVVKAKEREDIAIFFQKDVAAEIKTELANRLPDLEQMIYKVAGQAQTQQTGPSPESEFNLDPNIIIGGRPDQFKGIVAVVVEDIEGKKLWINHLPQLLQIQFADIDDCCGFLGPPYG